MTIMSGGFGLCGIAENLIGRVARFRREEPDGDLQQCRRRRFRARPAAADAADQENDLVLCRREQDFEKQYLAGELELEFNPQGTLAERIRAGGAGIPGFYTKTGVGTVIAEGKEHKEFDGETYIMERGLVADLAIVKAWKGDTAGNLVYRKTARNFNPMMATAAKVTVAEVEDLVPAGELDPGPHPHAGHFRAAHHRGGHG